MTISTGDTALYRLHYVNVEVVVAETNEEFAYLHAQETSRRIKKTGIQNKYGTNTILRIN